MADNTILVVLFVAFSLLFLRTQGQDFLDEPRFDHRGSAFCVAFLQNGFASQALKLHIITDEIDPVKVHVSFHTFRPFVVNITNDASAVVNIPSDLAVTPSVLSRNAISIQTNNQMQSISVFAQSSQLNGGDIFLVLPIRRYPSLARYQYAHFSSEPIRNNNEYSSFVLSNCNEEVVVPFLQSPAHLSGLVQVRDVYRQFIDSRELIEDQPTPLRMKEQFETLHFENDSLSMTGIKAWADRPFSFISGLTCDNQNCSNHFSQQIPPTYTWGYKFTSFPVVEINVSSYQIIALPAHNGTYLTYYCNDGTNGSNILTDEGYTFDLPSHLVCSFLANRPIGIVEILQGGNRGGAMVWLPPHNQYLNNTAFPSGILTNSGAIQEFIWVTVSADHFNTLLIQLDGLVLQQDRQRWSAIECSLLDVCAYGITVPISEGTHVMQHLECQGCLSVIIFGETETNNYAFTAGYAMDPIGVPVVSFTESLYTGSESINPNITLTRDGDVFIAIDIIVVIMNIPHADALPFNMDFNSFNETVHFNVGQRVASMSLNVRDDRRVESPENFTLHLMQTDPSVTTLFLPLEQSILQIQDNDMLVIGFTVGSVSLQEESETIELTLRSNIPLQDSGMNIIVRTQDGTATDTLDYDRLNDVLFLQPGDSEWKITVTVNNDNRLEGEEYFFVSFAIITTAVETTLSNSRVQINITDTDRVTVHFEQAVLSVDEGARIAQITLEKNGGSDLPVRVVLNTEDSTATSGIDYQSINNLLVEFSAEATEESINITILPDSVLESNEAFVVRLSSEANERVDFDLGSETSVSIMDDDSVAIGLSSEEISVNENDGVVMITVDIKQGVANRSFAFHVQTFEQQARQGSDFMELDRDLVFPPFQSSFAFPVTIIDNDIAEAASEGFTIGLTRSLSDNLIVEIVEFSRTTVAIKEDDNVLIEIDSVDFFLDGREGDNDLTFRLVRANDLVSVVPVSVFLVVDPDNAIENVDFTIDQVIEFLPDENEQFVTIQLLSDSEIESTETFFVLLAPFSGPVTVDLNQILTVSILDAEITTIEFSSALYTITEGGSVSLVFTVLGPLNISIPIIITTTPGSADVDDYTPVLGNEFIITPGMTQHTFTITTTDDEFFENAENFTVSMAINNGGSVAVGPRSTAMVTINDNDVATVSILQDSIEVSESGGHAIITVQRLGLSQIDMPLVVSVEEQSALGGEDFTFINGQTIIIPAEQSSVNVSISIVDDGIVEAQQETFLFKVASILPRVTVGGQDTIIVSITDNDDIEVFFNQSTYVTVEESDVVVITINSRGITNIPLNALVTTVDGTATEGQDYGVLRKTLTFNQSITEYQVPITIDLDGILEGMEEFTLRLESLSGLVTIGDGGQATVEINDGSELIFTGKNVVANELNSTASVCFSSNIPTVIPLNLQLVYAASFSNSAEVNVDYNVTQTLVIVPPSPLNPPSFCVNVIINSDSELESDEHFCLSVSSSTDGVTIEYTSTQYCPLMAVTVTIQDAGIVTTPICYLENSMVMTPFPRPSLSSPAYSYHGGCEHILVQQCNMEPIFTINTDHDPDDLAISRVAIRMNSSFIIINANDFTYTAQNFTTEESVGPNIKLFDDHVSVAVYDSSTEVDLLKLGIVVTLSNDFVNSTLRVVVNASDYLNEVYGNVCGLCGTLDGVLLYSDQNTRLTTRNTQHVEDFARSWFVNPEDQITRDNSRDCGTFGTDSVVGDPLYSVPVYSSNVSLESVSLCFEIHGAVGQVFNLVSDRCVSVNALYSSMINPNDGNIITSVGVKAVDRSGKCVDIVVSLSEQCLPYVDSVQTMYYDQFGVSVRKRGDKVSVAVPNCENEQLVMWMMCKTIAGQRMLDFSIRRGLNLRPTSHGLLGQFWNVPMKLFSYHAELPELIREDYDPDMLYMVTIQDPVSLLDTRQFIGELSKRSWDKSLRPCLYVGNSQGGKLSDIPGPKDSVIEGIYSHYAVSNGILSTSFTYSKFDRMLC